MQVKNHVQIAHEPYDLNIDFLSFDNGVKQLCAWVFIEIYDMLILILMFGICSKH